MTDLMATRKVAEMCRVSTKTVRRWVAEGKLNVIQQGRWEFRRAAVEYFLAQSEK